MSDSPQATDLAALLTRYAEAAVTVGREEASADPRCIDTDPELDRAYEACAKMRGEVDAAISLLVGAPSPSEERDALKEENHRLALDLMQEESEGNILADQVQKLTERAAAREQALVEMDALLCLQNAELEWIGKQFRAHRGPNGTTHFEAWVPGAHSCIVLAARRALAPASPSEREEQFRRELVDGIRSLHPAPLVQPEPQPEEQG